MYCVLVVNSDRSLLWSLSLDFEFSSKLVTVFEQL